MKKLFSATREFSAEEAVALRLKNGSLFRPWISFGIVVLLLGGALAWYLYSLHASIDAVERDRLSAQARIVDENLSAQLVATSGLLDSIRQDLLFLSAQKNGKTLVNKRLQAMSQAMVGVRTLLILDANGMASASNRGQLIGQDFGERDYFRVTRQGHDPAMLYVSPPFKTSLGVFAITVTKTIQDESGDFAGVITATLDPEYFSTLLDSIRYAPDARASIIHSDGTVFVNSPQHPGVDGMNLAKPGTFFTRHQDSGQRSSLFTGIVYATGDERMMAQRTIRPARLQMDKPLLLAVSRELPSIFAGWSEAALTLGGVSGALVLLSAFSLNMYLRRQQGVIVAEQARQSSEDRLRESEKQMAASQQIGNTGSWAYDIATGAIHASAHSLAMFGFAAVDRDYPLDDFLSCIPDRERVGQTLSLAITAEQAYDDEYIVNAADGSPSKTIHAMGRLEKDAQGNPLRVVGFIQDITKLKQLQEEVQQLAFHDALTKLPNRRLLVDRLSQTMATSKRTGGFGALMFLDLDNFKPVNDAHGHEVGDLLLIEAASRLKTCVREIDTVARFGGDEFVLLLGDLSADKAESTAQAGVVAEKISAILSEPYLLNIKNEGKADSTVEHHCSASIGVVIFISHEANQEDILNWADAAMYQAKAAGRNLIRFHAANASA